MIIHHFTSLIFLLFSIVYNMYGYETIVAMYLMEFTNPIYHLRWFLRSMELHTRTFAFVNDVIFAALFLVLRMLIGSYAMYVIIADSETHNFLKLGTMCMQLVNATFSYQIIMMIK